MQMKQTFQLFLIAGWSMMFFYSCSEDNDDDSGNSEVTYSDLPYTLETGSLPNPQISADNRLTLEGVKLGRMLFYDTQLSKDGSQSCASCHMQEFAFSDTAQFSIGVENLPGRRQAMAVFNMAWNTNEFFWDGRAHLLRDQSLMPIEDPLEMDETLENVITKLSASSLYTDQFKRAFLNGSIDETNISLALEQFMNSIVSHNSKYDKSERGEETLTASEERGKILFFTEFNPGFPALSGPDCVHCHGGENFENDRYMNNGLDSDLSSDIGREEATGNPNDKGKFKVPSLRNIELTPPYMHDGRFKTLEEVVDHYDHGIVSSTTLDPALEYTRSSGGLKLTQQEKEDLVAFLKTLTDQDLITNPNYSNPF